jgi:hypothetical protein
MRIAGRFRKAWEIGVSRDSLLLWLRIAAELAEKSIAILGGPLGQC